MVATFRTKTLIFTRVIHFNWLAKIELRGHGPSGWQYYCKVLLYTGTVLRVDDKDAETEETIGFIVTFLSLILF